MSQESRFDSLKEGVKLLQDGMEKITNSELNYSLDCLMVANNLLLTKYSPFKVGDKVVLNKAINFDDAFGWQGSMHFLKIGAIGNVKQVECDSRGYLRFYITFDNDHSKFTGKMTEPKDRSMYGFQEEDLIKLESKPECPCEDKEKYVFNPRINLLGYEKGAFIEVDLTGKVLGQYSSNYYEIKRIVK